MAGQLVYQKDQVNFETLNAALAAALGDAFGGLSLAGKTLHVHLTDKAKVPDTRAQTDAVMAAHDPAVLNEAQQAAAARQTLIDELSAADTWTEEQKGQALRLLWDIATGG